MAKEKLGSPEQQTDGTWKQWYLDTDTGQVSSISYGAPVDRVAAARERAAAVSAYYSDPWISQNVLGPMNQAAEDESRQREKLLQLQQNADTRAQGQLEINQADAQDRYRTNARNYVLAAERLRLDGRIAEANEMNQKAQIELRKAELVQQGVFKSADLFMQGAKPAYTPLYIDLMNRQPGLQPQSGRLADILAGRMPQGAFGSGTAGSGPTANDWLFGAGPTVTPDQMQARNEADKGLARGLAANINLAERGSYEKLDPVESEYLGGLFSDTGNDPGVVERAYRRAGIMQGAGGSARTTTGRGLFG